MRLGRHDRPLPDTPACELERRRALAAGRGVRESDHASCHHVQRLLELSSASRVGSCVTSFPDVPRNSSRTLPPLWASDGGDGRERDDGNDRRRARTVQARRRLLRNRDPGQDQTATATTAAPAQSEDTEPRAVVHTAGVRLEVVGDRRPRERPQRDETGDRRDGDERREALQPVARQREPPGRGERAPTAIPARE